MDNIFTRPLSLCHLVAPLLFTSSFVSATEQPEINHWSQFTFENDVMALVNASDDGYSNGISYAWGRSQYDSFESLDIPQWIRYISDWTFINQGDSKTYAISYGLSQSMYTPTEIEEPALIEDDRPYAGTMLWHAKIRNFADNRANSLGLSLGIAGPASLAEQSQTIIHKAIGATTPEGWDNQINNELVFRVSGEHIERFYDYKFTDTVGFDASSYSEAGIGNLRSDVGTGLTFRIGNLLDGSYAFINPVNSQSANVLSSKGEGFYWQAFASAYASYVFNDISLDGNTFSDSHSIEKVNEQGLLSLGVFLMYNSWGVAFATQRGNEQFVGQDSTSKYGSVTISYHH
ncbi:lipid A deacylase LpxR family protein [Psychromonas sp. Urea-02u-13]|uniref:lipid A deacylase LpxR family protein n=1 Tax=Psychromonas sp. Urea-02u-13 TaxID=2058326 RepID=UPI000C334ED3|nr:lipid A deacylase LpxR family protein [Psychromonas sp. Urea-02u-13]PKG39682.1 hypothetical protein CXF74_06940 [Psychromonas sp. Urea-02u-13]